MKFCGIDLHSNNSVLVITERWAQRLTRVFGMDVHTCAGCCGTMRIIACIEDAVLIKAILAHLAGKVYSPPPRSLPGRWRLARWPLEAAMWW